MPGGPEELLYLDVLRLVVGCREVLQHLGPGHGNICVNILTNQGEENRILLDQINRKKSRH